MTDEWNADVARQSLRGHELPPPGFDFAAASNRARVRYGFPAEPDRQTQPQLWAKWERNLHRPWRRVVPEYDLRPARSVRHGLPTANTTLLNWSGAVAAPPAGTPFNTVSATWVVPDAYPPASAWNGSGYNDGYYSSLHWVGIDGDGGAGANDVMQAGTATDVNVKNGVITVTCYAWYEWWYSATKNGLVELTNFTVNPGDVINVLVCAPFGNNNHGKASIANVTRGEYVAQGITPPSQTLTLAGSTAEWIVGRITLNDGTYATLADYAAIFFSDALASGSNYEIDLSAASLVNMTDGGSTTFSTALEVSNTVLECYYGTQQP